MYRRCTLLYLVESSMLCPAKHSRKNPPMMQFPMQLHGRALKTVVEKRTRITGISRSCEKVTCPTEWCAPATVVMKKDKKSIRLCVDLTKVNKFVVRERFMSATPLQVVSTISPNCKYFQPLMLSGDIIKFHLTLLVRNIQRLSPHSGATNIFEHRMA